ncbi:MAG: HAD family hydrolase [Chthonomonadales bacterium]|nr:HAD family hydrolase [Chthonomonadales bacterium]
METPFVGARAALFDLDGTLIETHIDFGQMKHEVLRLAEAHGVDRAPLEPLDILSAVEAGREARKVAAGEWAARAFRMEAFALLERIEAAQCASPIPIAGAGELLHHLRLRGVAVGIVTRNCARVSRRLLEAGGLACDVLVTRDDVERPKPDPGHLRAALRAMGFGGEGDARTASVMVGDHWMDVAAGRAAGLWTVGILRGREPAAFAPAAPDLLVPSMAALAERVCGRAGA